MREHAYKSGSAVYDAAVAKTTYRVPPYPSMHKSRHLSIECAAEDGVAINLGRRMTSAVFLSQTEVNSRRGGAENPTLTIVALAIRQADYIVQQMSRGTI